MVVHARQCLEGITPCPHGAADPREIGALGVDPRAVIDFSANCNPYGPPPGMLSRLSLSMATCYPDRDTTCLRSALAAKLGCREDQLIAGNGSAELVWLATRAFLEVGDEVVVLGPTFGEYEMAARVAGASVVRCLAPETTDFRPDVEYVANLVRLRRPKVLFLCNPNNPTGVYLQRQEVIALLEACAGRLMVVDEAYVSFVSEAWPLLDLLPAGNLLVLRSMTKDFCLPGLRIGYGIGGEDMVSALRKVQPPWSVNSLAQAAGTLCLSHDGYLASCLEKMKEAKAYLAARLDELGVRVVPSSANFFLLRVGDAARVRQELLLKGCCVRDCTSFGLPHYVRIAVRTMDECRFLARAVEEVIGGM